MVLFHSFTVFFRFGAEICFRTIMKLPQKGSFGTTTFSFDTLLFDSFNVFFRFLTEIHVRTIMKLPQEASFGTKMCSFGTSFTLS